MTDLDDYVAALPAERQEKIAARVEELVVDSSLDTKPVLGSVDETLAAFWARICTDRPRHELTDEERAAIDAAEADDHGARSHLYELLRET